MSWLDRQFRKWLYHPTAHVRQTTGWLIAVGVSPLYYCGPGDWCSSPNHAHRFASEAQARKAADTLKTIDPIRVEEHVWSSYP